MSQKALPNPVMITEERATWYKFGNAIVLFNPFHIKRLTLSVVTEEGGTLGKTQGISISDDTTEHD
jgi:hypothetical protein